MHKKKILTMAFASLLPISQAIWAEEAESVVVEQQMEAVETAVPSDTTAVADQIEAAEMSQTSEVVESSSPADSTQRHVMTRDEQYQALRKRAEGAGVMLPEHPPWHAAQREMIRPSMEERMEHRQKMMSMTDEERDAYRQQRYQEMRTRAEEMGMQMPETPPWVARRQAMDEEWAKHQEVIKGMSDEERAACHAMHRRHMGMMPGQKMGHGCGMGHQGCGMPHGGMSPRVAPGYGYGPGQAPYGPRNFWDPNQ